MADYVIPTTSQTDIVSNALEIAGDGCNEIGLVLADVQTNNVLGDSETSNAARTVDDSGRDVLDRYGISGNANITSASGAMVIDDLMQRISTKVQVASQMLSTANNINKSAARVISQG